jgi:hypothetical protein
MELDYTCRLASSFCTFFVDKIVRKRTNPTLND